MLSLRICKTALLALALLSAPAIARASSGPYPVQPQQQSDYQTFPQVVSASCAVSNYLLCPNGSTAGVASTASSLATVVLSGGSSQTGSIELSWDGYNYVTATLTQLGSVTTTTSITGDGAYTFKTYGAQIIQYRASSYSSGTESVIFHLYPAGAVASTLNGSTVITSPLDGSGNLKTAIQNTAAIKVDPSAVTQPVSGTVTASVSNFPSSQNVVCTSGCGAAPPFTYSVTTTTVAVTLKTGAGTFSEIHNLATASQTAGMTCAWYDSLTASGTPLYQVGPLGPSQVVTFAGGQGIHFLTGLTVSCSGGTPVTPGIMTLWI